MQKSLKRFHDDDGGIELIEFIIGGTLMVAIMMLIMVAIWGTTNARADATNSIITTNVPTAAQP
jgi:high-affinity Fe2+/Pb2+ permease